MTWEYTGPADSPLYSRRSGRVQILANGNTLIVETDGGRALELSTEAGLAEIVWEFRNPNRVGKNAELTASLYSLDRVAPGLTRWLSPQAP